MARARSLSIQEFAELSKKINAPFADRRELLASAGLDEASWSSTKEGMSLFLATRMRAGDRGAADLYRAAYEGRPLPSASAPIATAPARPAEAPVQAAPTDIPSYLRAPPKMAPIPQTTLPAPTPAVHPASSLSGQVETDEMDMSAIRGAAVPFPQARGANQARRAEQREADASLAKVERAHATSGEPKTGAADDAAVIRRMQEAFGGVGLGETRPADMADLKRAMPFPVGGESPRGLMPPEGHPRVESQAGAPAAIGGETPARPKVPAAFVSTSFLPEGSAPAEAKPFDGTARRQPPTVHISSGPQEQSGYTRAGSSGARPSLPFQRGGAVPAGPVPPGWTLMRYAALCIDLHASGLSEEEVLAAAGITRDERRALDAHWEHRMMTDPALRTEWKTHADRREAEIRNAPPGTLPKAPR